MTPHSVVLVGVYSTSFCKVGVYNTSFCNVGKVGVYDTSFCIVSRCVWHLILQQQALIVRCRWVCQSSLPVCPGSDVERGAGVRWMRGKRRVDPLSIKRQTAGRVWVDSANRFHIGLLLLSDTAVYKSV